MKPRFDDWVHATLRPREEARPRPGEIRRIVAGLQPQRRRRRRIALTVGLSAIVVGGVLTMSPRNTGGDAGRYEITGMMPDGRLKIQQPLTGAGTIVKSADEIEEWNRIDERTVMGEERIAGYNFQRYNGHELWNIVYHQIDAEGEELIVTRQPIYEPKVDLSVAEMRKILPYLDALVAAAQAGQAVARPRERHVFDGVPVDFEVWALDVPGVGRIEYGEGEPPGR